jgi:hypothetical protein
MQCVACCCFGIVDRLRVSSLGYLA